MNYSSSKPMIKILLFLNLATPTLIFANEIQEKESFEKQLSFSQAGEEKTLEIDNIFGDINVEGYAGETVQLLYIQTLIAEDRPSMAEAITHTSLEISEKDNRLLLYAQAPYRHRQNSRHHFGYRAKYDLVLKVPFDTHLILKTVNDGEIRVQNIRGQFNIANVNGAIYLEQIDGACQVSTVNGSINASFTNVPSSDCAFQTVNGDLTLSFASEPHGDYRLKTFNGEMYSDFPFSHLPTRPHTQTTKGRLTKIKVDGFVGVRIGAGGPQFKMDTLNGDILIREI